MGIFFKPDMATATEVPNVEAVLLLQRQIQAAAFMNQVSDAHQLRRGDVDEPRLTPADIRAILRT